MQVSQTVTLIEFLLGTDPSEPRLYYPQTPSAIWIPRALPISPIVPSDPTDGRGIEIHLRRWNDRDTGQYIQVLECDDFTLSRVGATGYLADAVCASARRMRSAACRMSAVLTALKIRHRFNLCSGQFRQGDYLHHRWPKESDTQ